VQTSCSLASQKTWLGAHARDRYLWSALAPQPEPEGDQQSLLAYFQSMLFAGNQDFPADRYSAFTSQSSFSQFYDAGTELGYGLAVKGQEYFGTARPDIPVRYVEPNSPAYRAGIRRGDRLRAINGRLVADRLLASDFADLVPSAPGQTVVLTFLIPQGQERSVTLAADVYDLVQVQGVSVLDGPSGRAGYLYLHSFTEQALDELGAAFQTFAGQGLDTVIIDLRYNGGGLVSVSQALASWVGGDAVRGQTFVDLLHNSQNQWRNRRYFFEVALRWPGVRRAYVLTGMRSCSASEQLISGLRGAGIETITVGSTTCGKPVGALPETHCDQVYSLVAFESVNGLGQGRYFNGIAPSCSAEDIPERDLWDPADGLVAAALAHVRDGSCAKGRQSPTPRRMRPSVPEPGFGVQPD